MEKSREFYLHSNQFSSMMASSFSSMDEVADAMLQVSPISSSSSDDHITMMPRGTNSPKRS